MPDLFVLLQAKEKIEAIRLRAHRLLVVRNGNIISRSDPIKYTLCKQEGNLDFTELN